MVRKHVFSSPEEAQAPPHPANTEPASGFVEMYACVPVGRLTEHTLPQLKLRRSPVESVTEPVPVPDLVTVKVNMGSTRVECDELLLVASGSGSVAATFALLVAVPGELGTTMMEAVMLSPETSFSREQVRTRLGCRPLLLG